MEKPEIARAASAPMAERGLEQNMSADNIGIDEFGRNVDRSIDMTFRRQMHDGIRIESCKQIGDRRAIADVGAAETIAPMALDRLQRGKVSGVSQLVDDQHVMAGVADQVTDQRRSDETSPAGN